MKREMLKAILATVLILLPALGAAGQDDWVRLTSPSGDWSVDIPASDWVVDAEEPVKKVYRRVPDRTVDITMHETSSAKSEFRRQSNAFEKVGGYEHFKGGDFVIRRNVVRYPEGDKRGKGAHAWFWFASSKGAYTLQVHTTDSKDELFEKVLRSIRVESAPLVKDPGPEVGVSRTVSIDTLKTDDRVLAALERPDSDEAGMKFDDTAAAADDTVYSRPLIVLRTPKAGYTSSARSQGISGSVVLSVTFRADGKIGSIKLVRSLERSLDRAAFDAARKIKFLPAEKDGKPVETTKRLSFGFSIH